MLLDCCVPGGMCVCVEDAVAPVLCLFPQGWAAAVAAAGGGVLQVGRADSLTHVDPCPYSRAPPLSLTCPNNSSVSDGLPSLQSDWTTENCLYPLRNLVRHHLIRLFAICTLAKEYQGSIRVHEHTCMPMPDPSRIPNVW